MSNQTPKKSGFAWTVLRGAARAALTLVAVVIFGIAALYSMLILSVEWLRCFVRRDYRTYEHDPTKRQGPVDAGASPTRVRARGRRPPLRTLAGIPIIGMSIWLRGVSRVAFGPDPNA